MGTLASAMTTAQAVFDEFDYYVRNESEVSARLSKILAETIALTRENLAHTNAMDKRACIDMVFHSLQATKYVYCEDLGDTMVVRTIINLWHVARKKGIH